MSSRTPDGFDKITDTVIRGSLAAMDRAAKRARDIAIQTNTAIIVSDEKGNIRRIPADELYREKQIEKLQTLRGTIPTHFQFDRIDANTR